MTVEAKKFNALVIKSPECWGWAGTIDKTGYSRMGAKRAHRVSYELYKGSIPKGMIIDHQCRNRFCVNPTHLKAVTRKGNRENLSGAHKNNISGVRGVHYHKATGKWRARVGHNKEVIYLGLFSTVEEASKAARDKRIELLNNSVIDREESDG